MHAITYTQLGAPLSCAPGVDTFLEVLTATASVFARNDDRAAGIGCSEITIPALWSGTWLLRVRQTATGSTTASGYYLDLTY